MILKKKTKIIATYGPSISDIQVLKSVVDRGVDIIRLNFSHGSDEMFKKAIDDIRNVEKSLEDKRPIGILADIQGPKIRIGNLPEEGVPVKTRDRVEIAVQESDEKARPLAQQDNNLSHEKLIRICVDYSEFVREVPKNATILIEDGLIELCVVEKTDQGTLIAEVIVGGIIYSRKGVNVPQAPFSTLAITEKDYTNIIFCIDHDIDFLALSFIRSAQEVRHVKQFLHHRKSTVKVIAKIEKEEAITNLTSILMASDGLLVARGDLAVEIGNERVPMIQKKIIHEANLHAKPVIVATQMLMSMVENARPTRAEASDVANSILDGTDMVMLSNETAIGAYPKESVLMMSKIIHEVELHNPSSEVLIGAHEWMLEEKDKVSMAILQSAVRLASVVSARLLCVVTQSGQSALFVSKCRPPCPILAITPRIDVFHQMSQVFGVFPVHMPDMAPLMMHTSVFDEIIERLNAHSYCRRSDTIVMTAGLPSLEVGSTNTIKLHWGKKE